MIVSETQGQPGWFMRSRVLLTQIGAVIPALAVIGATGYSSWGHIEHVGLMVAEPKAYLLPVAVDGMMLSGALWALVDRLRGFEPRGWSTFGIFLGSAMTVTFNVWSAWQRGVAAMLVSAVYAITFLATVEMAFHPGSVALGETAKAMRRMTRRMRKFTAASVEYTKTMGLAPAVAEAIPVVVPEETTPAPSPDAPAPRKRAPRAPAVPAMKRRAKQGQGGGIQRMRERDAREALALAAAQAETVPAVREIIDATVVSAPVPTGVGVSIFREPDQGATMGTP